MRDHELMPLYRRLTAIFLLMHKLQEHSLQSGAIPSPRNSWI